VLAFVLLLPCDVDAQVVSRATGNVSVNASGVSLLQLLEKLAEIHPFDRLIVSPEVGSRIVTVTVENADPVQAIKEVLAAAGVDYVLSSNRLVVGHSDFSDAARPVDAASAERVEHSENVRERTTETAAVDAVPSDSETQRREAELMQALAPPAVPIAPGAPVELPFPAPDGRTALTGIKELQPTRAVPFPIDPVPGQTVPAPNDPRTLELLMALSPKRGPGNR
jgi:hypothetical protein